MFPDRAVDAILPLHNAALWMTEEGYALFQACSDTSLALPEEVDETDLDEMLSTVRTSVLIGYKKVVCSILLHVCSAH
jgi:hypothetical protein